ncbi:hypothetical protein D3C86_1621010 [compost metagenome]
MVFGPVLGDRLETCVFLNLAGEDPDLLDDLSGRPLDDGLANPDPPILEQKGRECLVGLHRHGEMAGHRLADGLLDRDVEDLGVGVREGPDREVDGDPLLVEHLDSRFDPVVTGFEGGLRGRVERDRHGLLL